MKSPSLTEKEEGGVCVCVVLKKNDDRVIVVSDEPFYVTETVNEDLENYVNNEVKKEKIMSYTVMSSLMTANTRLQLFFRVVLLMYRMHAPSFIRQRHRKA